MTMTKRDFEALAGALRESHSGEKRTADYKAVVRVVNKLLPHLDRSNPSFDRVRFIEACGLEAVPRPRPLDERFALCA